MKAPKIRVEWAPEGQEDLRQALEQVGPGLWAQRLLTELDAVLALVEAFPGLGRPGSIPGAREHLLSELPFLVVYEVFEQRLIVLRLLHTARQWPPAKPRARKKK